MIYSHADQERIERLRVHLRVPERLGLIGVFCDLDIEGGERWRARIEAEIDSSSLCLVMLSDDLLTSPYVIETEIPRILQREKEGVLQVVPVLLHPCAWQLFPWLSDRQLFMQDGRALGEGSPEEVEAHFVTLVLKVLDWLHEEPEHDPPAARSGDAVMDQKTDTVEAAKVLQARERFRRKSRTLSLARAILRRRAQLEWAPQGYIVDVGRKSTHLIELELLLRRRSFVDAWRRYDDAEWALLYSALLDAMTKTIRVPGATLLLGYFDNDHGDANGITVSINNGLVDPAAYNSLLGFIEMGTYAAFEAVPLAGGRLLDPLSSIAYVMERPDPHAVGIPAPPPALASAELAADAAELYWMQLCRDISFTDYATSSVIGDACADLDNLPGYRGPVDLSTNMVTPQVLFRMNVPGVLDGPMAAILRLVTAWSGRSVPVFDGDASPTDVVTMSDVCDILVNSSLLVPELGGEDLIWGDDLYVGPGQNLAQGETLVPIKGCVPPRGGGGVTGTAQRNPDCRSVPGDNTFYGRYAGVSALDRTEPLATAFAVDFVGHVLYDGESSPRVAGGALCGDPFAVSRVRDSESGSGGGLYDSNSYNINSPNLMISAVGEGVLPS